MRTQEARPTQRRGPFAGVDPGRRSRAAGFAVVLAAGCAGAIDRPPAPGAGSSAAHAVATAAPAPSPAEIVVAPAPLRRLTREEYNNAVRDLLGDTTRPADGFPPDEDAGGFESNSIAPVTDLLVERYMDAAHALATAAVRRIDALAPCPARPGPAGGFAPYAPDGRYPFRCHRRVGTAGRCAGEFVDTFGWLGFRRPLVDAERATLLGIYADKAKLSGYAEGIRLVVEAMLQSPQFLYRVEPVEDARAHPGATRAVTGYEMATRLSFFIWASTPDAGLLDDAGAGRLTTPDDVARAARRMVVDRRAIDGFRSFHRQWLGLGKLDTESKDPALFPAFTPELERSMVEETLRFTSEAVRAGGDGVAALLTSNRSFVDAKLSTLYGVPPPPGEGFSPVELPPRERAGVLTQASLLAVLAGPDQTSPVLRGQFVREKLLCDEVPPPPAGVALTPPRVDPKLTTKQRFAQHRENASCAGCHALMDPIGLGFEHYDAIGRWRAEEGPFPIDATGRVSSTEDVNVSFDGAVELAARLAASGQVRRCIATQWFRFALGRGERDDDQASIDGAYQAFARRLRRPRADRRDREERRVPPRGERRGGAP